jgi:hypothetical protein
MKEIYGSTSVLKSVLGNNALKVVIFILKLTLFESSERLKKVKQITRIVSDAISNAELVWMLIQLDLEKLKNKFDNTDKIQQEAVECAKRTVSCV